MVNNFLGIRERAISYVDKNGPVLPIRISKEFGVTTIVSGAILSELVNEAKLNMTEHLRVGGSPVYYIKGQESKLEDFIKHLNENDIRMLSILREKGIVKDKECTPLQRVSYRIVKDFAKILILKKDDGEKEIFWRYYLIDEEIAKKKILDLFNKKQVKKENIKITEASEKRGEEIKEERKKEIKVSKPRIKKEGSLDIVKGFFVANDITVLSEFIVKKDKDINYIISFDTFLGNLKYFVKFKDKKSINEGDISLAFNEAGRLPLLFLSNGELTKIAKSMIEKDYKSVIFRRI